MSSKGYSHFFSKIFQHICVSLNVNFNESLTNDVVSFEQLGPDVFKCLQFCEYVHFSQVSFLLESMSYQCHPLTIYKDHAQWDLGSSVTSEVQE